MAQPIRIRAAVAVGVAVAAVGCPRDGRADELAELPHLDGYRVGLQSMIASDREEPSAAEATGGFGVGARWQRGWASPWAVPALHVDVGFQGADYNTLDLASDLEAGWSMGPLVEGEGGFAVAGRHAFQPHGQLIHAGDFYVDIAPHGRLVHSSAGDWGTRPRDVGPDAFMDYELGGSVWLQRGSETGLERDTAMAFELGYDARLTTYFIGDLDPRPFRVIHHAFAGMGFRRVAHALRWSVLLFQPSWTFVTAEVDDSSVSWKRFDYDFVKARLHSGAGDGLRGLVETFLGGSTAWRADAGPLHTAKMGFTLRAEDRERVGVGLTIAHEPTFDPSASRALGVTSFEILSEVDDAPNHYGASVRARVDRLVELQREVDDVWQQHFSGELYTQLFGLQLGAQARASHGPPSGSMGWKPFSDPTDWSAYVGGVLRATYESAPGSAR